MTPRLRVSAVRWGTLPLLLAASCLTALSAQAPIHDAQYPDADIAYGLSIYNAKCVTCHGPQGDGAGGVNLRSGKFRNATSDRDLARFIRAGSPAGMPPMALDNSEMTGIVAYLRNMRSEEHTSELQSHSDLVCRLLL